MTTGEHLSFVVWAVLPPKLIERTTEAALKKVGRRMLASKAFASEVLKKADELEDIVFNPEAPSWGVWPLWFDREGLEFCWAIGLILGFRIRAFLLDHQIDCGFARTVIESLIEDKRKGSFKPRGRRLAVKLLAQEDGIWHAWYEDQSGNYRLVSLQTTEKAIADKIALILATELGSPRAAEASPGVETVFRDWLKEKQMEIQRRDARFLSAKHSRSS